MMIVLLILVGVSVLAYALYRRPDWRHWLLEQVRSVPAWQVALAAIILIALMAQDARVVVLALLAMLVLLFGLEWRREFAYLMTLDDQAFPGRNDKLIWAMLLIVLPPIGLWLFRSHRLAHAREAKKVGGFDEI
jgi:hypothetical protein